MYFWGYSDPGLVHLNFVSPTATSTGLTFALHF